MGTSLNSSYLFRHALTMAVDALKTFFTILITFTFLYAPTAFAEDIEALKKQLDASPESLKTRQSLAKAYLESEKPELAIEVLKPKLENLNAEGLLLLAKSFENTKDALNEQKTLEQLTVNFPQFVAGFVAFGDFYFRSSQAKSDPKLILNSASNFRSAIELNAGYRPAYDGLMKVYEFSKNWYEVRVLLGDMVLRFGKRPDLLGKLCQRNTLDGFFVSARKFCLEAIGVDGKNPDNYVYLSLVENNEGNIKKAESILKMVTTKFPKSEFALSNYGDFLIQQKNLPSAQKSYQAAVQAEPKGFRAQIGLAKTSFELKKYELALEAYKEACSLRPHTSYRLVKRASDWLRHRKEVDLQAKYSSLLDKCMGTGEDTRSPANSKDDYRSPFATHSKNKIPEATGF